MLNHCFEHLQIRANTAVFCMRGLLLSLKALHCSFFPDIVSTFSSLISRAFVMIILARSVIVIKDAEFFFDHLDDFEFSFFQLATIEIRLRKFQLSVIR